MKSLFWKRTEVQITTDKPGAELRFEVGSTLTYLEDQKKAIAFGGLRADSAVEAGKEVKEEPKKPSFSFKGGFSLGEKQAAVLENLQALDVANSKWTISNCTGKHPSVRVHHYALYEQPYLIVYSGLEKKLLNDMYALNTRTGIWKKMFSLESPPPRLFGGFVQLKDRKYLIGGCKHPENGTDLYSDAWSLSFANVNWEVSGGDVPGSVWAHVEYNVSVH